MLLGAHSEEPSKRHDGIGHAPADLFDHQALDAADIAPFRVVDRGSFDTSLSMSGLPVVCAVAMVVSSCISHVNAQTPGWLQANEQSFAAGFQQRYGYARDQAEREVDNWLKSRPSCRKVLCSRRPKPRISRRGFSFK